MPRNDDRGIEHLPLSHRFIRQIKYNRRVLAKALIGPGKNEQKCSHQNIQENAREGAYPIMLDLPYSRPLRNRYFPVRIWTWVALLIRGFNGCSLPTCLQVPAQSWLT